MKRAMVYLGLQDDDEYQYEQYGYDGYPPDEHDGLAEPGDPYARTAGPGYERGPERAPEPERPTDVRSLRPAPEAYPASEPTVRTIPRDSTPSGVTMSSGSNRGLRAGMGSARVHIVEPHGFNDAQEIGDRLKVGQPVILNLQGVARDLQRRLIDFSSGLAYAVGGSMSRVADQVFLLTPSDVEVSQEEKERLQARGLFHG
jgi:cell division inhibitor SepF